MEPDIDYDELDEGIDVDVDIEGDGSTSSTEEYISYDRVLHGPLYGPEETEWDSFYADDQQRFYNVSQDYEEGVKVYPFYFLDMPSSEAVIQSGGRPFLDEREERAWRLSEFLEDVEGKYSRSLSIIMNAQIREWSMEHEDLIGFKLVLRKLMNIYLHSRRRM